MDPRKKAVILIIVGLAWMAIFMQIQRSASITPLNPAAKRMEIKRLNYKPRNDSEGTIYATMMTGEALEGRYAQVRHTGREDDETLYAVSNGPSGSVRENYMRLIDMTFGAEFEDAPKYRAFLEGDRGTKMKCEFYLSLFASDGVGVCRTNRGAAYRILF